MIQIRKTNDKNHIDNKPVSSDNKILDTDDFTRSVMDNKDSRPALVSKHVNIPSPEKEKVAVLKRKDKEEYSSTSTSGLASTTKQRKIEPNLFIDKRIKTEEESPITSLQLLIKTPIKSLQPSEPIEQKSNVLQITNYANSVKKQKLKSTEKFKKIPSPCERFNSSEGEAELSSTLQQSLTKPGQYVPIKQYLFELEDSYSSSDDKGLLFDDIEHDADREFCRRVSKLPLSQWINEGQNLINNQVELVGELIRERIELSEKFQVVTTIINQRAEALNVQGDMLEAKLGKIRKLGNEILNII